MKVEPGADVFDRLHRDQQQKILGTKAYEAYEALQVDLQDFVGRRQDPKWGTMRYSRSLKDALANSGMPKVIHTRVVDEPFASPNTTLDLRQAIRRWRDAAGGDLRSFELASLANEGTGFVALDHPRRLQVMNNINWDARAGYQRFLNDRVAQGVLSRSDAQALLEAMPKTKAERLAETILHEYGHVLTVAKVGNYTEAGWDRLPPSLLSQIENGLRESNFLSRSYRDRNYSIGEVIAEDVRRYLSGEFSRLGALTYWHDAKDLRSAFRRAKDVWIWLNAP